MRFALTLCVLVGSCASMVAIPLRHCAAAELAGPEGRVDSRSPHASGSRRAVAAAQSEYQPGSAEVLDNPSYFRRMPSQQIACDPQMFTFSGAPPRSDGQHLGSDGDHQSHGQTNQPRQFLSRRRCGHCLQVRLDLLR